ncbi:MAG: hypothetical protein Rubg2KO_27700 [Rubricoccaceae bacterium]
MPPHTRPPTVTAPYTTGIQYQASKRAPARAAKAAPTKASTALTSISNAPVRARVNTFAMDIISGLLSIRS